VISRRRPWPLAPGAVIVATLAHAAIAWANGDHAHGPDAGPPVPLVVWLVGIGLAVVVAFVVVRQARHGGEYLRRIQGFSRNARLLLIRTPFSGLSVSIWRLSSTCTCWRRATTRSSSLSSRRSTGRPRPRRHPAGILSDLFGRRRMFLSPTPAHPGTAR